MIGREGGSETKYFIFIGYLNTMGRERASSEPPEPPLDPPLVFRREKRYEFCKTE